MGGFTASPFGAGQMDRFRTGLVASAAGAMLSLGSALAADMPVKALAPAPRVHRLERRLCRRACGLWRRHEGFRVFSDFAARGFLAGGQVGINKQIASFVFGLEIDGSWADIKGSQTLSIGGPLIGVQVNQTAASKIDGLVTIAGRAGLAADRWFVFGKAGIAVAHENHSWQSVNLVSRPCLAAPPRLPQAEARPVFCRCWASVRNMRWAETGPSRANTTIFIWAAGT